MSTGLGRKVLLKKNVPPERYQNYSNTFDSFSHSQELNVAGIIDKYNYMLPFWECYISNLNTCIRRFCKA